MGVNVLVLDKYMIKDKISEPVLNCTEYAYISGFHHLGGGAHGSRG